MGVLDGRVCLVTGGANGIGREHSLLLASEGAHVVVNDLGGATDGTGADNSAAQLVADEITAAGGRAVANTESVTDFEGAERMVKAAVEAFGDLHVVVNNAGILRDRMLVSMAEDEWDAVVGVHMKGTFNVSHHAAAYWREQEKEGKSGQRAIINTSSGAGLHGNPGQTNYAAAKAGIAAMTIVTAAGCSASAGDTSGVEGDDNDNVCESSKKVGCLFMARGEFLALPREKLSQKMVVKPFVIARSRSNTQIIVARPIFVSQALKFDIALAVIMMMKSMAVMGMIV